MNYFLLLVIVGVCGGSYYMYTNDQQQITTLQQQVKDLSAQVENGGAGTKGTAAAPASAASPLSTVQPVSPVSTVTPAARATGVTPAAPAAQTPAPTHVPLTVAQPDHMNAIDAAANAAVAAASSAGIGTVTTLDHKTYTNCKVLKVEKDGVTFSHDDGITKVMYPMMPPDVQKKFGYTPEGAVAQTEAEIRAAQQTEAATNAAPAVQ